MVNGFSTIPHISKLAKHCRDFPFSDELFYAANYIAAKWFTLASTQYDVTGTIPGYKLKSYALLSIGALGEC